MGAMNKEWHAEHRMPSKPTREDRGKWHAAHHEACACREPSAKESELIEEWNAAHPQH